MLNGAIEYLYQYSMPEVTVQPGLWCWARTLIFTIFTIFTVKLRWSRFTCAYPPKNHFPPCKCIVNGTFWRVWWVQTTIKLFKQHIYPLYTRSSPFNDFQYPLTCIAWMLFAKFSVLDRRHVVPLERVVTPSFKFSSTLAKPRRRLSL